MPYQMSEEQNAIRNVIAESGLPLLTGSTQDIAWANTIRLQLLMEANGTIARLHQVSPESKISHTNLEDAILAARRLREATPAEWWIAHRNMDMDTLLRELSHRSYAMEYGGK